MEELDEIIKQINEEFGEGTITTADKIDPPENPYRDFMDRNPMMDGGMLVKPSADGSRPGYAGELTIKAREYLESLPKNSDIVVLDIAKKLKMDRGVIDNVLKEKKFKNKNFRKLRKAGFLTNEDFVKEYKNYQNSDVFKTGEDSEFAKYLNDKGFKAETKSGEFTSKSVNVRRKRLNVKSVSPVALRLSDKDILKEAKRFNIDTKNLNPEELREKVLNKRTRENVVKRMQENPEFADRIRKEAIQRAKKRYTKLKSTEEGRGILKEQRIKTKAKEYQIKGLDPPASTAKELLWKDVVKIAKDDGRFTIQSGYEKSMKKDNFYSNKIKIKDSVTGKTFTFNTLENFVNKNASSFNVKNFNEVMKPYKQKQYINDKGLRNTLNEVLIPGWSSGDPRTAYTIQHDFGRLNNPFKVSLAFYDDNTKEYKIRSDFEKAWEKSKISKTPLTDKKLAFNVFKEDIDRLNIRSSPSMVTRDRAFGKELDLKSILQKAKKEGAILPRGTLKEAAEFDKQILNSIVSNSKLKQCKIPAADGGRIGFALSDECIRDGLNETKKAAAAGDKKAARQLVETAEAASKGGRLLKNILGPGALLGEAVFEGALIGNRFLEGKPLDQAWAESYLSYLDPRKYAGQLDPRLMERERMLTRTINDETIDGPNANLLRAGFAAQDQLAAANKAFEDRDLAARAGKNIRYAPAAADAREQAARANLSANIISSDAFREASKQAREYLDAQEGKNRFDLGIFGTPQGELSEDRRMFEANKAMKNLYAQYSDDEIRSFLKQSLGTNDDKLIDKYLELTGVTERITPAVTRTLSGLDVLRTGDQIEQATQRIADAGGVANLAKGGRAGFKVGKLAKLRKSKVRDEVKTIIDDSIKKQEEREFSPNLDLDALIKKTLNEDFFDKKDSIIDSINISEAKKRKNLPYNMRVFEEPKNLDFYDAITKSNFRTKTGPYFDRIRRLKRAGGGLLKQAGDRSGPPPESGPNSQGLQGLLNRVKKG